MSDDNSVRAEIVNEWLDKADADLYSAEKMLELDWPYPSIIAYHAQQAAEKYLKAFLIHKKREFPRTHNIERLLSIIEEFDPETKDILSNLVDLSQYATDTRYPGVFPEVRREEVANSVLLAKLACQTLTGIIDNETESKK